MEDYNKDTLEYRWGASNVKRKKTKWGEGMQTLEFKKGESAALRKWFKTRRLEYRKELKQKRKSLKEIRTDKKRRKGDKNEIIQKTVEL